MAAKKTLKQILAGTLNLLILPGIGSLILGRTRDGIIQLFLAVGGIALSIYSLVAFFSWAGLGFGGKEAEVAFQDPRFIESLQQRMLENPPTVLGMPYGVAMLLGVVMMAGGWVYSAVSSVKGEKKVEQGA